MKEQIILIGAGGHCISCINVIEQEDRFQVHAILDRKDKQGELVLNYRVNGTDDDIANYVNNSSFLITVGQISSPQVRLDLFNLIKKLNGNFATVISPFSKISRYAMIGVGTIIMNGVLINANVNIGENCIINSSANIDHDVQIGNHCHISTGAILNGGVEIEHNCFVGSGAVLIQNIKVCSGVVIGAGAIVIKSIVKPGVYFGNPARLIGKI
jgi:sugar O-acyltransferase (sialic acid O-acetyltransferase NeuD family)